MKRKVLYSLAIFGLLAGCETQDIEVADQPTDQQALTTTIDLKMVEVDLPAKPVTKRGRSSRKCQRCWTASTDKGDK